MSAHINPIEKVAATEFCTNCRTINFTEIFSIDPSSIVSDFNSPGRKVADLVGSPRKVSKSSSPCPLCHLYATVVGGYQSSRSTDTGAKADECLYSLIVRSTAKLHKNDSAFTGEKRTADPDTLPRLILQIFREPFEPFMAFVTDMFLFDQNSLLDGHNEAKGGSCGYVNTNILRSFVDYCCKNHINSPICGDSNQIQGPELPSFKVIDVESLCIIYAGPGPVYTALSYRWGEQAYDPSCQPFDENGNLKDASALPLVISDALKVTRDMGFRYCWVDRYCIPQNDPSAMEIQFGHMDQIYRHATVTIISDSYSPFLPGVTQKLETTALPVRVGECNIAAAALKFDGMQHRIRWSPWAERAWTYQEGLFSRRRLFFTDKGVYYECGRMASGEAGFAAPQPRWNLREEDRAPWLSPTTSPKREQALLDCLKTYSKRRLTFAKDKLAAALGIFHAFEAPGQLMRHYLGTPVLRLASVETGSVDDLVTGLMKGMLFRQGSARYHGLPSWSWVGWTGEISFFTMNLKNLPSTETSSTQMAPRITSELMDAAPCHTDICHF
ncbi:tol protein [Fusarium langsethiae]|uniref:Tol protein n=1 Tax=Fusarium langsethiae TaxID=179993 RepID=A0A0M9ENY3_FUSLA|nr:tol protein [Fusarium langsethiae]GKU08210.1 unnamed protein product [Fusarium langsethiae]